MSDPSSEPDPVEALAEEFLERQRQGERPDVAEYARRYPEWADRIRKVFRALALLEDARPAEATGSVAGSPAGPAAAVLQQVGDYRIVREVGRGGMGVVYEAEQVSLGRHVALKVLPAQALLDPRHLRRFQREAKAAARLHHTNIVPVYGVGEQDGVHYYVMQFIQGLGLDEVLTELKRLRLDQQAPPAGAESCKGLSAAAVAQALLTAEFRFAGAVPPTAEGEKQDTASGVALPGQSDGVRSESGRAYWRSVAQIGVQVAEALAHAATLGITHRDVKPSNLLLDAQGNVWVTDFGLAKVAADTDDLTNTGDVVGTMRYMAPERFQGHSDVRSDLYSLGLTLYELLTLRPAFDEADRNKLVAQVLHGAPPRPRQVNPAVPRDLETIVLKATDRDPARRYQTAAELADDLRRFVEDRPVRARRVSLRERAWRWCKRNPAIAGLTAAVATLLITVAVGATVAAFYFGEQAETEKHLKIDAQQARAKAEEKEKESQRTLTDMHTAAGLAAGARDDPRQAVLWFAHAARLAGDDRERAEANRIRAAAWGRLAIQPVRAFVHPAEWVENNLAFHPGGRYLLSHGFNPATSETTCRLWDLEREETLPFPGKAGIVCAAAWDTTGERLAVGTPQGAVTIYRFPGGEPVQRVPLAGRIARVLFSPDGRYCAVAAAHRVRVWDCRQAGFATPELEHPKPVNTLAFHPRGELLATGCEDQCCRVFAVPAEKHSPLFPPVPHNASGGSRTTGSSEGSRTTGLTPVAPVFFDEGRRLLTYRDEASGRDPRTGRVLGVLPFGKPGMSPTIALSGDGKHLVLASRDTDGPQVRLGDVAPAWVGSPNLVRIYDTASARPVSPPLQHGSLQPVWSAAFSPDGRTLLTGCGDRTARLWSVPEGKPLGGPLAHLTSVNSVAFAPDGRHLVTAQHGGLIRLWALPAGLPPAYRMPVAPSLVRLSPDGRFLLPAGLSRWNGDLRGTQVFDLASGRRVGPPLEANGLLLDAVFSPDGLQVAAAVSQAVSPAERADRQGQQPGQLLLWDWRAGKFQQEPLRLPSEPRKLDYSPDGRQLAVICARGELVVLDPARGKTLRQWRAHPPHLHNGAYVNNGAVRFSPDNFSLLTFGTSANSVRVWDARTGRLRHELKHDGKCDDVQFSPDGRLVATAGRDRRVRVWELATARQLADLAHPEITLSARFSPDGKQLLSACRDSLARLWDWRAGRLVCPPFQHEHEVHAVAFTPDGRHVLSASDDGVLKIWEGHTGKPVCPPFALGGAGLSLVVTPDGKRVAVGGFMKDLPVFQLDDWLAPPTLGPDDLCLWGEIVSGQRVADGGGVTNLTADEWLERWRDFRRRHPEYGSVAPAERGRDSETR
jgi:WD40 repeat protein/serine/threonine protein kinase